MGDEWNDLITIDGTDDYQWSYENLILNNHNYDNVTLTAGGAEMIRISPEGFYIRGTLVEENANEAHKVYQAFKQWLSWNILTSSSENNN